MTGPGHAFRPPLVVAERLWGRGTGSLSVRQFFPDRLLDDESIRTHATKHNPAKLHGAFANPIV